MNTQFVVIHYGESTLKKRNRSLFEDKLLSNLRAKLGVLGVRKFRKLSARALVEFEQPTPWKDIAGKIRKVFGFSTASPVHRTALTMEDLEATAVSAAAELDFKSFAVKTKRANKNFPLTSPEISAAIGAAIQEKTGARVDLTNPEKTFFVEILEREILFSSERIKGMGGLPVGISGNVAALLSGGIDSPVASWMMMKRGLKVDFIHFHSKPFTDDASIEKVEDMAAKLASWQGKSRIVLVPFGNLQKEIVTKVPAKYRVVLYRRFMMRIASLIANDLKAGALVTGEALGQVASQTLTNLGAVEAASGLPVLRPLVGMDKQEIVDKAREVGTFDLSIQPHQDCCSFLQPPNPVTKSSDDRLSGVEACLDVDAMVASAVAELEWKEIDSE
jgi:thiamine biosynthesis protein ThiI